MGRAGIRMDGGSGRLLTLRSHPQGGHTRTVVTPCTGPKRGERESEMRTKHLLAAWEQG